MIPLDDMNATMERVAKYMEIAAAASKKANEEMEAMFARHTQKPTQLRVIRGGLDAAYEHEPMPRFHGDE